MTKKSPDAVDVQIGANVNRIRRMRGMSQEALAGRLGITFQQIQKYEKGMNRVSGSRLQQVADALEVQVTEFFPATTSDAMKEISQFSPTALDVARAVDELPADRRAAALRVVRALAA